MMGRKRIWLKRVFGELKPTVRSEIRSDSMARRDGSDVWALPEESGAVSRKAIAELLALRSRWRTRGFLEAGRRHQWRECPCHRRNH
jgi:hypothetical protein